MRRRLAVSAGLVVACLTCAGPANANQGVGTSVVGGQPASIAQFPFMARIVATEGATAYVCSGTVVSSNMVLTAAHCLLNESGTAFLQPANFEVLTATGDLTAPGVVSGAERLAIDSGYVHSGPFGGWHDAGLIQLAAPVAAPPVKLASSEIWGPGTGGYAVGWGLTEARGAPPSEMRAGEIVVQSAGYCEGKIGAQFHADAELCSLDYPTYESATCNGDSGGPLLIVTNQELVEIGITSFGVGEGCPTTSPRVDTRVDVEAPWVQREIASHPAASSAPVPASARPALPPRAPAPELPRLTLSRAKRDTFSVVRTDPRLGPRFRARLDYEVSCRSNSRTSANCTVSWHQWPNDYRGSVTIFEEWKGSTPVWNYRYTIRSVNDECYLHPGHRGRCPVRFIRSYRPIGRRGAT